MLNFDEFLFRETYEELIKVKSFRECFRDVFMPLLNDIGLLWQTNTINPCHEHFIVNLIKQKLLVNLENLQNTNDYDDSKLFVLYLPPNEVHDLGITYFHYEVLLRGYRVINLGSSLPLVDLENIIKLHENIIFGTYFTVQPDDMKVYLTEFQELICSDKERELWIMGQKHRDLEKSDYKENIRFFDSVTEAILQLQQ